MDTAVRVLNCEYRAAGHGSTPGRVEIEHDLRAYFAPALAEGLKLALGSEATVWVIRRVDCDVTLRQGAGGLPELARQVATAAVNAVLRMVSNGMEDIIRFEDSWDLGAQLVVDLLDDRAHLCWYYAGLSDVLDMPLPEAVTHVLTSPRLGGMHTLGRLAARGRLDAVLHIIPPEVIGHLVGDERAPDAALRPLFALALELARDIAQPDDQERLLALYLDSGPPWPDWRDPVALANAVVHALAFVLRLEPGLRERAVAARAAIQAHAAAVDWLDRTALLVGVERLLSEAPRAPKPRTVGRARRLSTRHRAILRDLADACAVSWPGIDPDRGDCAENRARLWAALSARSEVWAEDAVASELVAAVLRELAQPSGATRPLLGELAALGAAPAQRVLGAGQPVGIAREDYGEHQPRRPETIGVASEHAGVALLIRAALDLRLSALGAATRFPAPGMAVAATLISLAEPGDAGLELMLGSALGVPLDTASEPARRRFERGLLRTLSSRGLLKGTPVLARTSVGGRTVLLAGIEKPALWPLCQIVETKSDAASARRRWRRQWVQAEGARIPAWPVCEDDALAAALAPLRWTGRATTPTAVTLAATGLVLVRAWGRWLPGLGHSSLRYLFDHFIRRPGTIYRDGEEVRVVLERQPLDAVLELSGALGTVDARRALGLTLRLELSPP